VFFAILNKFLGRAFSRSSFERGAEIGGDESLEIRVQFRHLGDGARLLRRL